MTKREIRAVRLIADELSYRLILMQHDASDGKLIDPELVKWMRSSIGVIVEHLEEEEKE
jgi:hypothetical protein